jgi:hypothetical protein
LQCDPPVSGAKADTGPTCQRHAPTKPPPVTVSVSARGLKPSGTTCYSPRPRLITSKLAAPPLLFPPHRSSSCAFKPSEVVAAIFVGNSATLSHFRLLLSRSPHPLFLYERDSPRHRRSHREVAAPPPLSSVAGGSQPPSSSPNPSSSPSTTT